MHMGGSSADVPARVHRANGGVVSTWRNPTRLVFGSGAVDMLPEECARFGRSALIVTDDVLAGGPLVARARRMLDDAGVVVSVFDEVRSQPTLDVARRAAGVLAAGRAEVVVGFGGGSSMDVAKAAAVGAVNPSFLEESGWWQPSGLLIPDLPQPRRPVPLLQVPTTQGTGAEVQQVASLRVGPGGRKKLVLHPLLFALVAIVDPALTMSLPVQRVAEGAVEVTRLLPPYLTETGRTELQDGLCLAAAAVVLEAVPRALAVDSDFEARSDIALAATTSAQGWISFGRAPFGNPLWLAQNQLGSLLGLRKGAMLAALLPAYLKRLEQAPGPTGWGAPSRWRRASEILGLSGDGARPGLGPSDALAARFARWGLPAGLRELGVTPKHVPELVAQTTLAWGESGLGWAGEEDLAGLFTAGL